MAGESAMELTDVNSQKYRSHLFTVRVWHEAVGDGCTEWRGELKHVHSGEVRYFRRWSALVALLRAILSDLEPDHP